MTRRYSPCHRVYLSFASPYCGAEAKATSVINNPPCNLSLKLNCTDLTLLRFTPLKALNGTRTVFNVLGPLANPAGARDGVFGVYSAELARTYAEALAGLGARHAFVVHGSGGLDELTPAGPNLVVEVVDGAIRESELDPLDVGLERSDPAELRGGSPSENAAAIRRLLDGERSARRDAVVLNAAAALVAAGVVDGLAEGVSAAAQAVDSGDAGTTLERLVAFSNAVPA